MENHLRAATTLAHLLDSQFSLGKFKFGLDPLLDLIPVLGDLVALMLATYIIWIGVRLGVPEKKVAEMVRNSIFDFILGLFPVLGFVGDAFYKSNLRNLKIIREYAGRQIIEGEVV